MHKTPEVIISGELKPSCHIMIKVDSTLINNYFDVKNLDGSVWKHCHWGDLGSWTTNLLLKIQYQNVSHSILKFDGILGNFGIDLF